MTPDELFTALLEHTKNYGATTGSYEFFERLYRLSLTGMGILVDPGSGEKLETMGLYCTRMVLEQRKPGKKFVVFDVGANEGQFCAKLLNVFNGASIQIHSFEPSAQAFAKLNAGLAGRNLPVSTYNIALGDREETLPLFTNKPGSQIASLTKRRLEHHGIEMTPMETVEVKTLDLFCRENGTEEIDFLKLDVEGHEMKCLLGAADMIERGKVAAIQFEFGGTNIDSRTFLQDFFYLLKKYDIHRVLLDGIRRIETYSELDEIFSAQNFLAFRR